MVMNGAMGTGGAGQEKEAVLDKANALRIGQLLVAILEMPSNFISQ